MQKVVRIFHSFKESEEADKKFYLSLTPTQRMEILFELIARGKRDGTSERFERVYRIIKLRES